MAIRIGSILPLILFHWLWNLVLLSSASIPETGILIGTIGTLLGPVNLVMSIFLWRSLRKR